MDNWSNVACLFEHETTYENIPMKISVWLTAHLGIDGLVIAYRQDQPSVYSRIMISPMKGEKPSSEIIANEIELSKKELVRYIQND
jgi:hypothetical protein